MKRLILLLAIVGGTLSAGAAAATFFDDSPTIRIDRIPAGTVKPGQRVLIYGRILSDHRFCRQERKIQLRDVRGKSSHWISNDITDRDGEYRFVIRPKDSMTLFTHIAGLTQENYGGADTCDSATSSDLRVVVRR